VTDLSGPARRNSVAHPRAGHPQWQAGPPARERKRPILTPSAVALDPAQNWTATAAQAAASKKADDIVNIDVGEVLAITDSFVICSAGNDRLVRTIAEEIERQIKELGGPAPLRIEGLREAQWVLLDYGYFVVHVFLEETRQFYNLERLWADAPRVAWEQPAVAVAVAE